MRTDFEDDSDTEIYDYLMRIRSDDPFDQSSWNILCLEMFRRIMKDRAENEGAAKYED